MFKLAASSGSGAARSPGCSNSTTEKVGSMGGGLRRGAVSWSSVLTWPQQPHKRLAVGGAFPEGGGVASEQWSGTSVSQSSSVAESKESTYTIYRMIIIQ